MVFLVIFFFNQFTWNPIAKTWVRTRGEGGQQGLSEKYYLKLKSKKKTFTDDKKVWRKKLTFVRIIFTSSVNSVNLVKMFFFLMTFFFYHYCDFAFSENSNSLYWNFFVIMRSIFNLLNAGVHSVCNFSTVPQKDDHAKVYLRRRVRTITYYLNVVRKCDWRMFK